MWQWASHSPPSAPVTRPAQLGKNKKRIFPHRLTWALPGLWSSPPSMKIKKIPVVVAWEKGGPVQSNRRSRKAHCRPHTFQEDLTYICLSSGEPLSMEIPDSIWKGELSPQGCHWDLWFVFGGQFPPLFNGMYIAKSLSTAIWAILRYLRHDTISVDSGEDGHPFQYFWNTLFAFEEVKDFLFF